MFLVPSVLWIQFRNHWRYICCLLVPWLLLVHWFVGSSVVGCVCLAQVYDLGPWGYSWSCLCFLTGLVLVVFFCLLHLCRVGALSRQLEMFFFYVLLLFWGGLRCSAYAPMSGHAVVLFFMFGEVEISSAVRFCWYFKVDMIENSCMKNSSRITCSIQYPLFFLK
jgi:hypothetical protein